MQYYLPDVISATDYYPFGSPMSGRNLDNEKYRYGFNGQEKDDEIYGTGNANTAQFWEYDTRLGRRWNLDSVRKEWESPYSCFSDNPIYFIDPFGYTVDNYHVHSDGRIEVERNKDKTNTYYYHTKDGTVENLGEFNVITYEGHVLIEMPSSKEYYKKVLQNEKNFLLEDVAAGFIGATYTFFLDNQYSTKVTQFQTNTGEHSEKSAYLNYGAIDIHLYEGWNGSILNHQCPSGIITVIIKARQQNGKAVFYDGFVMLGR